MRRDETRQYRVVINHEEQYSLWPKENTEPKGWKNTGFTGTRQACLDYIEEVWTDMRPRNWRDQVVALLQGR